MKNEHRPMSFRMPETKDAQAILRMIASSPPLDVNSLYCYLLICTHFRKTSVVAESSAGLIGFISAYIRPDAPETLFVWQVVVQSDQRGKGLARSMLDELLSRNYPARLRYLETTVNPTNTSSRSLFYSAARRLHTGLTESILFTENDFGENSHEKEILYRIGPFDTDESKEEIQYENH